MSGKYRQSDLWSMQQENSMLEERLRGRELKQKLNQAKNPQPQAQAQTQASSQSYSNPFQWNADYRSEASEKARQAEIERTSAERKQDARDAMNLRHEDDDYTRDKNSEARDKEFKSRQDAMEQAQVRQRTREKTDAGAAWNAALSR